MSTCSVCRELLAHLDGLIDDLVLVEKAHELLISAMSRDEVIRLLESDGPGRITREQLELVLDCTCWFLGHNDNQRVQNLLEAVKSALKMAPREAPVMETVQ